MKLENFVIPLRYKIKPFLTSLRVYIEPKLCLIWKVIFLFDSCRINFKPINKVCQKISNYFQDEN